MEFSPRISSNNNGKIPKFASDWSAGGRRRRGSFQNLRNTLLIAPGLSCPLSRSLSRFLRRKRAGTARVSLPRPSRSFSISVSGSLPLRFVYMLGSPPSSSGIRNGEHAAVQRVRERHREPGTPTPAPLPHSRSLSPFPPFLLPARVLAAARQHGRRATSFSPFSLPLSSSLDLSSLRLSSAFDCFSSPTLPPVTEEREGWEREFLYFSLNSVHGCVRPPPDMHVRSLMCAFAASFRPPPPPSTRDYL